MAKVAIVGMGRLGRAVLRYIVKNTTKVEVVLVSDPNMTAEQISYHLQYDSTGQKLKSVSVERESDGPDGASIVINDNGTHIDVWSADACSDAYVPRLRNMGINAVIDCMGKDPTESENRIKVYISNGMRTVFMLGRGTQNDDLLFVPGVVSDDGLTRSSIIYIPSPAIQASCLLLKGILEINKTVDFVTASTVQSYTADQQLTDGLSGDELSRAAAWNFAAVASDMKIVSNIFPEIRGKTPSTRLMVRTPTLLGGMVRVQAFVPGGMSGESEDAYLRRLFEAAKKSIGEDLFGVSYDALVSGDITGDTHGVTVLANRCGVTEFDGMTMVTLVGLYDNENGYAAQVVRTVEACDKLQLLSLDADEPLIKLSDIKLKKSN